MKIYNLKMVKFFFGNIDAINWKIKKSCFQTNKQIIFLSDKVTLNEIENKIFQISLFDDINFNKAYVIDASKWKFNDQKIFSFIDKLIKSSFLIFLFSNGKNIDKKKFENLKIDFVKVYQLSTKDKEEMIDFALKNNNLEISNEIKDFLKENLILNFSFINNEIRKLYLLNQTIPLTKKNVEQTIFYFNNDNIFKAIDCWLKKDFKNMIKIINHLLVEFPQISTLIQIFSTQIMQFKMFILANKYKLSKIEILQSLNIPIFQQKKYFELFFANNILNIINGILDDLYQVDLQIKLGGINSYFSFVNALIKNR